VKKLTIGERVKLRREELGLSVDELATILNKSRATIYRYESNDIENMSIKILEPLAKALRTTQSYLLGLDVENIRVNKEDDFSSAISKLDENDKKFVLEFIKKISSK
jgi:transcriptional regulator with XRE-family HTH domain